MPLGVIVEIGEDIEPHFFNFFRQKWFRWQTLKVSKGRQVDDVVERLEGVLSEKWFPYRVDSCK